MNNYKEKYLKYKTKYINLRQKYINTNVSLIGGGVEELKEILGKLCNDTTSGYLVNLDEELTASLEIILSKISDIKLSDVEQIIEFIKKLKEKEGSYDLLPLFNIIPNEITKKMLMQFFNINPKLLVYIGNYKFNTSDIILPIDQITYLIEHNEKLTDILRIFNFNHNEIRLEELISFHRKLFSRQFVLDWLKTLKESYTFDLIIDIIDLELNEKELELVKKLLKDRVLIMQYIRVLRTYNIGNLIPFLVQVIDSNEDSIKIGFDFIMYINSYINSYIKNNPSHTISDLINTINGIALFDKITPPHIKCYYFIIAFLIGLHSTNISPIDLYKSTGSIMTLGYHNRIFQEMFIINPPTLKDVIANINNDVLNNFVLPKLI